MSVICVTGAFFCFQKLQRSYPIPVYLFYVWFLSGILLSLLSNWGGLAFSPLQIALLILAGVFSWYGNYAYNIAIKYESNIGYVESVSSIRLPLVYIVSIVFLDSKLDLIKLIGLIFVVIGVTLVTDMKLSLKLENTKWLIWALTSGIMFALLIIFNRILNTQGIEAQTALPIWILIASFCYAMTAYTNKQSFQPKGKLLFLATAIILTVVGQLSLFTAYSTAPNLAYPTAIANSRLILMYLLSFLFIQQPFRVKRFLGILLATLAIVMLS